jgi:hypothetical protein
MKLTPAASVLMSASPDFGSGLEHLLQNVRAAELMNADRFHGADYDYARLCQNRRSSSE